MKRKWILLLLVLAAVGVGIGWYVASIPTGPYAELEIKLAPLATKMGWAKEGEWLHKYSEPGQTFNAYLWGSPVRRDAKRNTIYLCLLGEFTPAQQKVLDLTK